MWVTFVMSLITIPVFIYFDNRQISEDELETIQHLTLSQDSYYTGGRRSSIKINLTNTERTLVINLEELNCLRHTDIIDNFKKGDTISIKIFSSDKTAFYNPSFISRFQKIYGLNKNGKEFIQLSCRNLVSTMKTKAATYASISSSILSLFLAIFIFKPRTRQRAIGQIRIDPILMVCICWLLVFAIFRWN